MPKTPLAIMPCNAPPDEGDRLMVQIPLQHHALVDAFNGQMLTPWGATLKSGKQEALDALLLAGTDPNTKGWHGASELYAASDVGDIATVRYMIDSGTNPSIKTDYGWAPLH